MLNGRIKIFTSANTINESNIIKELETALLKHQVNVYEENYLENYRRGIQPILNKEKKVRPEINHKIVVNNADPVVTFKNGYFMVKPAYYVSREKNKNSKIKKLNDYLYLSGKHKADNQMTNDFHTMGVACLYVRPNKSDEIPFSAYAIDPRRAFVVYSYDVDAHPVFAVNLVVDGDNAFIDVYTKEYIYRLKGEYHNEFSIVDKTPMVSNISYYPDDRRIRKEKNNLGYIPIIEYQANENRLASFEAGIPIADAINEIESSRQDGIDQFIQSLLVLVNCHLPEKEDGQPTTANDIRESGLIELDTDGDNKADIKNLAEQLDQTQTQVTLQDLQDKFYNVCAMPNTNRNGGGSSDNGSAVYLREGYAQADTYARNTEDNFKYSNAYFDEIILHILSVKGLIKNLSISDFELKIEPNTSSNLLVKSQSAINLKQFGLSPELILEKTGLSADPVADVEKSKEYIKLMWQTEKKETVVDEAIKSGQQVEELDNVERQEIK